MDFRFQGISWAISRRPGAGPLAVALVWMLTVGAAGAEQLSDPTRPSDVPEAVEGGAPVSSLQSVLISPTRRVAIIDGQTLTVGDRIGAATLVRISESEVVLRDAEGTKRLSLFPGAQKRPATVKAGEAKGTASRGAKKGGKGKP